MGDEAIIVIVLAACTAAVFIVRAIASGVLKLQEMQLRHRSGLLVGSDNDRLQRIEQAIDSIAVEVERISEGQRFTAKLLSERAESREPRA